MIYKLILNKINNQTNLYAPLVMTKQIEKALHLAEILYLDLPENSLVKNFINKFSQKSIKVTGLINYEGNLKSYLNFSWGTDLNSFKLYNFYSAGIYLFSHTLTDLQYIGSTMNFQSRVHAHQSDSRHPSTKFYKFVSENTWNNIVFGSLYETTN